MPLSAMTDELLTLRQRYEREGLQENVAAVEATLKQLERHPRRWAVSAMTSREAQYQHLSLY